MQGLSKTICILGFILAGFAFADVKLPAVIGGNMVLQQKTDVPIWGWADPGEKITIAGSWSPQEKANTQADSEGKWKAYLKTPTAGGPYRITIEANNTITLHNVLIGEVWVCSGQSNMQWALHQADNPQEEIANADYPEIHFFYVSRETAEHPKDDCEGSWEICRPETAANFSAVGYFFGRELYRKLDVPVGLICTAWGGTPAEAWTSKEMLQKDFPEFETDIQRVLHPEDNMEAYRREFQEKMEVWNDQIAALDPGSQQNWQNPGLDDSDWQTMELPKPWSQTELKDLDGIVWFRRITNLPPSWARHDLELSLGPIDDFDTVWVNGRYIGTTSNYRTTRKYIIPASVSRVGPNVIAVRVIDGLSEGGFWGKEDQMRIGPIGADQKATATVARTWKYKVSLANPPRRLPYPPSLDPKPYNYQSSTVLYNGMIAPLLPYKIAGAIWYQGENNVGRHEQYVRLFPAMITDWRNRWQSGRFPFYFVQIAPYRYDDSKDTSSALLREAQMKTLSVLDHVGMAVTMDIGVENNIHPTNKQEVGKRLALWALANDYGKDLVYSGPVYRQMKVEDGKIRLLFDYAEGGLTAKDGPLTDFVIAGEDEKFVPAKAEIEGESVVVSSDEVPNPVAVRYAFTNWACPNLYNKAGLPASSFRTDNW